MKHIISLGAGVQSSTMALMAAHGEITPMPDAAIFADTQDEPPEVYEHLAWLKSVLPFPIHVVSEGKLSQRLLDGGFEGARMRKPSPVRTERTEMAEIRTFTKKLVSIQAVQWLGDNSDEVISFMGREAWQAGKWTINPLQNVVHIFTLEGEMRADVNDWIIRGVKGEFYPCKPDIFAATYTEGVAAPSLPSQHHKLDTDSQVCFYEQEFYVLSNFSSFRLYWRGFDFDTSEAAYHWEKFHDWPSIQDAILHARSAHEVFKIAEMHKSARSKYWDQVKLDIMADILRAKVRQHEYVRRKLLETGNRYLVEDSWRDNFWGWGPNREGQNWLGRLWMKVREELAALSGDKVSAAEANKGNEQINGSRFL